MRTYAGEGPGFSPAVGGYLCPVESGARLRVGTDAAGEQLWPTAEEAAATKLAELEAEIARLKGERS